MVFAAASCMANAAQPSPKPTTQAEAAHAAMMLLAPADEYFGPLKQSILGIRNTIRDAGLRYDVNHDIGDRTIASAALTERAIRDWQQRYPRDHGVAIAIFQLQRLYAKIDSDQGRMKAAATAKWLFTAYGASPQAKELHKLIAAELLAAPSPTVVATVEPTSIPVFSPLTAPTFSIPTAAPYNGQPAPSAAPTKH